jgi:integrase/recombinase XerD
LKALLRFLHATGRVSASLAAAAPAAAGWHGGELPRALEPGQVERLLASCDQRTASGLRDFAMLTLLWRLGLRAGEVAACRVGDVDWRAGEILIHGKGNRQEKLPLPVDVGEALADYCCRGRPHRRCQALFLQKTAPYGPLTRNAVSQAVRQACQRAGLPPVGAHRLRHTAATEMLRAGTSLAAIGQVLRHRDVATTAIYAKVDRIALRALARPWPGTVA